MPAKGHFSKELIKKNRWTQVGQSFAGTKRRARFAVCVCDCGTREIVNIENIKHGKSQSCGCVSVETSRRLNTTHGNNTKHNPSLTYRSWAAMKQRCSQSSLCPEYYRDKGIRVCEQWQSFEGFLADMGERPSKSHSIDRIDPNGNYEPGNCRWATAAQQCRNTSANRLITYDGRTMCLTDWEEEKGVARGVFRDRLGRLGWSVERTLETPQIRFRGVNKKRKAVASTQEDS